MLENPKIPKELIISCLQNNYGLKVKTITFLPLGADVNAAVYRVSTDDKKVYFLKLQKNFNETLVTLPLYLQSLGIKEIIAPIKTRSNQNWADFNEYTMILYPFVQGKNGFEIELSDQQKRDFGSAFCAIHSAKIPSELKACIKKETFSSKYRENLKKFLVQIKNQTICEPIAKKLSRFIKAKQNEIITIIERAEKLAIKLKSHTYEFVLCHTDIHGGLIVTINGLF